MAHPIGNEHRAHHHEKDRVKHLCGGGYARGGKVDAGEKQYTKALNADADGVKESGKKTKHRGDRVKRAKGGRVKHKGGHGKTNVNVIVAPSGGDKGPIAGLGPKPPGQMPPMPAAPPAAGMAPPPMAAKPPMPPMAGAGGPPGMPPMPMRKRGGRVPHDTKEPVRHAKGAKGASETNPKLLKGATTSSLAGPSTAAGYTEKVAAQNAKKELSHFGGSQVGRAKGGKVNGGVNGADGQGRTGIGFRLPVQHSGNKDDTQNIGRKKPITYAKGGKVRADGGPIHTIRTGWKRDTDANGTRTDTPNWGRAKGGKVDQIERGGMKQYAKEVSFDAKQDGDGDKPAGGRKQYGDGWNTHTKPTNRATGGPIYADGREGSGMGPVMHEGSRGGLARIEKAKRAARNNHV